MVVVASVSAPPNILILGGGFGGMTAARKLEQLVRPDEATITVVSRENFSRFFSSFAFCQSTFERKEAMPQPMS